MFSMQSVCYNPLIATFQLSSAASLNLGQSQNGVLGNGLIKVYFYFQVENINTCLTFLVNLGVNIDGITAKGTI